MQKLCAYKVLRYFFFRIQHNTIFSSLCPLDILQICTYNAIAYKAIFLNNLLNELMFISTYTVNIGGSRFVVRKMATIRKLI